MGEYIILSVKNYLERGAYYFVYDRTSDMFSLQKYKGYEMKLSVKRATEAIGKFKLMIKTNDSLLDEELSYPYKESDFNLEIFITVR